MLDDPRDPAVLERRMAAVGAVKQVVNIIWLISRTELPLAERSAAEARVYLAWIETAVERLAGPEHEDDRNPAMHVVLGPERGYCGALTREVLRQLPPHGELGLVGRQLEARLDPEARPRVRFALAGAVSHEESEAVAFRVAQAVAEHAGSRRVVIHYPATRGAALVRVPLLGGVRLARRVHLEVMSPMEEVLDAALRELITARLAVAVAVALETELRMRVQAAEGARDGCSRRLEALSGQWRVARQEQITRELLEVVSGHLAAGG